MVELRHKKLRSTRSLTLGADPELFTFSKGKLLPAYEFLPSKLDGGTMYWDGFQAEWKYTTQETGTCQNNLVFHTRNKLKSLDFRLKRFDPDATLTLTNVVKIPTKLLQTANPLHVELGCMRSFNAYKL